MKVTYTHAAQQLIDSGLPSAGLIALNRGSGPIPMVNLAKLDEPVAQLLAIAQSFDAEVN